MGDTPRSVLDLIEKFDRNIDEYKNPNYKETMIRVEFVNPLFKALGWDVDNEAGYALAYRDVIHEDALKVAGSTKAPDYSFRVGGTRKFFVETKKPSVNLKDDPAPAFQLRRYAYSARLPISILTDFEEFIIYNCRTKPSIKDKPSASRIRYYTFRDYAEKWDEISSVFHRESILRGSFDKYAQDTKGKRGTAEIDKDFLADLDQWRLALAHNFALRNPNLTVRELNFAVQKTIDRLIFLRMCEDRGIENYGQLEALVNGTRIYPRLVEVYRKADDRYNSGLFHFTTHNGDASHPDILTPDLNLDDKVLKTIIQNLYYPRCPYEFSLLPVEVLGNAYEQFLGKTIRLTAGHQARIEEKPEVRKAGGVYYTPEYIVTYIVKNTVGKLLEGKTPKEVADLRILDPACGSGSFLLGAYRSLLDWHLGWYKDERERTSKLPTVPPPKGRRKRKSDPDAIFQGQGGDWLLTTAEKKRILLNNIHGVDIDQQAVEVTKLSLLLRVLEDENQDTLNKQMTLWRERALPDLGNNIKCGNSLIGPDYLDGQLLPDEEELRRVNPFDWNSEFPEIFKAGGFDAVIGNPPYVFGRDWKALNVSDNVKRYLRTTYKTSPYQLDMFSIFMEQASCLCRMGGWLGQIVPNVWLTNIYSSSTRAFILGHARELCLLTPPPNIFPGLTVDTVVYTFQKTSKPAQHFQVKALQEGQAVEIATHHTSQYLDGDRPISTTLDLTTVDLVFRLKDQYPTLQTLAKITRGVHPYRTGGYGQTAFGSGTQTKRDVQERPYHSQTRKLGYRPFIYGRDLQRFTPVKAVDFITYGPWLAEPRQSEFFEGERIYSRKILGERLVVTIEVSDSVADQQVYITKPFEHAPPAVYLAGILASKLIVFFIKTYYDEAHDAFPQIKVGQLKQLPIRTIDFDDPVDTARHDRMVQLVEQMLALHKELPEATTGHEQDLIRRRIDATDRQIDTLVYELYELTPEDIEIVEKSVR